MFFQSQAFSTEKPDCVWLFAIYKKAKGVHKSQIVKIWLQKSQISNPGKKALIWVARFRTSLVTLGCVMSQHLVFDNAPVNEIIQSFCPKTALEMTEVLRFSKVAAITSRHEMSLPPRQNPTFWTQIVTDSKISLFCRSKPTSAITRKGFRKGAVTD